MGRLAYWLSDFVCVRERKEAFEFQVTRAPVVSIECHCDPVWKH